jgi:hypothetical protein
MPVMTGFDQAGLGAPAEATGTPPPVSVWMARSIVRSHARGRLEAELHSIAVDLLGRCQPDELGGECGAWVAATIDEAVARVCESSLAALAETLDSRLDAAPPGVARRVHEAAVRHDAGYL